MSTVTEAMKKIEANISTGVWDKQKRWEMKREVLFETTKRVSEVDDAMLSYATAGLRLIRSTENAQAVIRCSSQPAGS